MLDTLGCIMALVFLPFMALFELLKKIYALILLLIFHSKSQKNIYVQTYKIQLPSNTSISNCKDILHIYLKNPSRISKHAPGIIDTFNVCECKYKLYPSIFFKKTEHYAIHSEKYKNDYFKYCITFNQKRESRYNYVYIDTYITGKSKNCTFEEFNTKVKKYLTREIIEQSLSGNITLQELNFYYNLNSILNHIFSNTQSVLSSLSSTKYEYDD